MKIKKRSAAPLLGFFIGAICFFFASPLEAKQWAVVAKDALDYRFLKRQAAALSDFVRLRGLANPLVFQNQNAVNVHYLDALEIVIFEVPGELAAPSLKRFFNTELVEEDQSFSVPRVADVVAWPVGVTETSARIPWGVAKVRAPAAWDLGADGAGAKVLVLDSGIDRTVPQLRDRIIAGRAFLDATVPQESRDPFLDEVGHGTHVSGTIVADGSDGGIQGVAPKAQVLMGKVCTDFCSLLGVVQGIDWGIQNRVDVVNMSIGSSSTSLAIERALSRANNAKISLVAAAGNAGTEELDFPASSPLVISVGAVDRLDRRAEFSQFGEGLDLSAPGVNILSTVPTGSGRAAEISIREGTATRVVQLAQFSTSPSMPSSQTISFVDAGSSVGSDVQGIPVYGKFALVSISDRYPTYRSLLNLKRLGAAGIILVSTNEALSRNEAPGELNQYPLYMIGRANGELIRRLLRDDSSLVGHLSVRVTNEDNYSGTSMASPHVAGVIALMRSVEPDIEPDQVLAILKRTARRVGRANEYGAGIVDANSAVRATLETNAEGQDSP